MRAKLRRLKNQYWMLGQDRAKLERTKDRLTVEIEHLREAQLELQAKAHEIQTELILSAKAKTAKTAKPAKPTDAEAEAEAFEIYKTLDIHDFVELLAARQKGRKK